MADGGEGTVAALVAAAGGRFCEVDVIDPLGVKMTACYGLTGDGKTAIVEMAAASGLALVPPPMRNPLKTPPATARGNSSKLHWMPALTTSSSVSGGSARRRWWRRDAPGIRYEAAGRPSGGDIGFGGAGLARLDRIDGRSIEPRLKSCRIEVACDVDNPLTGSKGASAVYGPQKGATPEMVAELDQSQPLCRPDQEKLRH